MLSCEVAMYFEIFRCLLCFHVTLSQPSSCFSVYFYFDLASAGLKLCWCGELCSVLWWQGAFSSNSIDCSPSHKQFPQGVEQQKKNPLQLITKQTQLLNDCKTFFFQ